MSSSIFNVFFAVLLLLPWPFEAAEAHSGKARFHVIVDTDCAADDLRTLCMLLGNREVEVLAITTSEGALPPGESARCVRRLLGSFGHEGIPVGTGRSTGASAPEWRTHSRQIDWGDPEEAVSADRQDAPVLMARALEGEEERVVVLALGALTNLDDLLRDRPELAGRIDRIVWYGTASADPRSANYRADSLAARRVLESGVRTAVVSEHPACPVVVTPGLLDSIAEVPTRYARRIVQSHRSAPLAQLVERRHLGLWDDLAAVYLFAPDLFEEEPGLSASVVCCRLADERAAAGAREALIAILRGKPDSESRVFYGFPAGAELYASDVAPIVGRAIERHGPEEWRAGVLTNELHGHLGIYATVGVKMGIRAREYFDIGVDDIRVTSYAGSRPPLSCMNDGLQVSTGGTVGHGLFTVAGDAPLRPAARFRFKDKTIRLTLKPEYARRIARDVRRGVERYGGLTEAYWQYVRNLAIRYWLEFDRREMFVLEVDPDGA